MIYIIFLFVFVWAFVFFTKKTKTETSPKTKSKEGLGCCGARSPPHPPKPSKTPNTRRTTPKIKTKHSPPRDLCRKKRSSHKKWRFMIYIPFFWGPKHVDHKLPFFWPEMLLYTEGEGLCRS